MAYLKIVAKESNINITNNTSDVSVDLYLYDSYGWWNSDPCQGSITIEGNKKTFTHSYERASSGIWIGSHKATVTHNADGKKICSISATFDMDQDEIGVIKASKQLTLSTIPRKSTFKSMGELNIGSHTNVNFGVAAVNTFYHKFAYKMTGENGSTTGWIYPKGKTPVKGDSVSFTIPLDYCKYITKSTKGKIDVWLGTYTAPSSSMIGESYDWFTVYVPEFVKPGIDNIVIEEAVSKIKSGLGVYVQNQSKLKITTSAHGARGSTIQGVTVSVSNDKYYGYSPITNIISSSGNVNVKVTIRDSRNRTASTTKTIYVYPYTKPNIQSINSKLVGSGANAYTRINIKGNISSINNKNSKSLVIKYKKAVDTSWKTKSVSLDKYAFDTHVEIPNTDSMFTWQFLAELSDKITTTKIEVATGTPVLSCYAGGKGVAIGKEADKAGFDVGYDTAYLRGHPIADFVKKRYYKDSWYVLEHEWAKTVMCIGKFRKIVTPSMWANFGSSSYVNLGIYKFPEKILYSRVVATIHDSGGGVYLGMENPTDTGTGKMYAYRALTPKKNVEIWINIIVFGELTHG